MKNPLPSIFIAFLMAAAFPAGSYALTAFQIIERSDNAVRGTTQVAEIEIVIKGRRFTRILKMKSWDNRIAKKSFAEITAPKKDAGNRFLLISNEKLMWHYSPIMGRETKIHPSMMLQPWMGSDFTNDDIVKESSVIEDYTHALDGKKTVDGMECHVVVLTPKPDAPVVWGKIIYYARVSDYLPVREEFFDQRGNLKKVLAFSGFKKMHDRVIPTVYKMVSVDRKSPDGRMKDEYTKMIIKKISFNLRIPDSVFSLRNLKRK
ncbi:MAG: outer membrane lipoprotein-sorting protein [Chrysiogenales bacterium]|nr:MAG: outer membrane lipoprotein-sorting protein [Chrysiogenales bacterium]